MSRLIATTHWPKITSSYKTLRREILRCGDYSFYYAKEDQELREFCVWSDLIDSWDFSTEIKNIRRGYSYFVTGIPPKASEIDDHYLMREEMLPVAIDQVADSRLKIWIVANIPFNFGETVDSYIESMDSPITTKAQRLAIIAGIREKIWVQTLRDSAMQSIEFMEKVHGISVEEYIQNIRLSREEKERLKGETGFSLKKDLCLRKMEEETGERMNEFYKPVILMSDIVQYHPGINENFKVLAEIAKTDEEFCQLAWDCVPRHIKANIRTIGKRRRMAPYSELKVKNEKGINEREEARQAMGYVLFQVAFVTYWTSAEETTVKYSYKGEKKFDNLVTFCYQERKKPYIKISDLLNTNRPPDFHDPSLDSNYVPDSDVPYAQHDLNKALEQPSIGFIRPKDFGTLEEKLIHSTHAFLRFFVNFFRNAEKADCSDEAKIKLINLQLLKMFKQLVLELMSDAAFEKDLSDFKVQDFLDGKIGFGNWTSNEKFPNFFKELTLDEKVNEKFLFFGEFLDLYHPDELVHPVIEDFSMDELTREREEFLEEMENELEELSESEFYLEWLNCKRYLIEFVHFGPVTRTFSETMPNGEMKISYVIRHLAKILSRAASKNKKIAACLDAFFNTIISTLCMGVKLRLSLSRSQWKRKEEEKDYL